ncbi:AMP-binding protein [Corynebacterium glyciniphilum]|uniref:AMP-binding protein n=1 Tax=Corynebacterium glyciniphilum TaxID=1404244 RepID=UPI0026538A60|nr:AMP-binding protein [Corynebacterium glyciniphilum]MDN6704594.1 AMP-binding protein [Corynebacterium glyciniphilum]
MLNVQTVDWYSLLDALAADSRSSFKYPLFYWQNELVDSLNVDVELWHTDDIVLRSRSDDERAARDSYILGDLRDIDSDLSAQTNSALRGRRAELEHLHVEAKNYRESLGEIFNPDSDHTDGRNEFIAFSRGYEEMEIFCNDLAVSDSSDGVIVVPYGASERAKSFGACISLMEKRIPFRFVSGGRPASRFYIEDHISSGAGWNPSTESPIVAAAVLQSSGSSGEPKTTVVSDYELSNLIHNARRWLRLDIGYSKVLLAAAPEFDASYFEICLAVASGSLPVTITDNSSVVSAIIEACTRGAVTHLVATPSVIALLAASDFEFPAVVLSVGEYLSDEVLGLCSQGGNTEVIDLYGPSEAGIWTTLRYAGDGHVEHQPIDNAYVRVVAEEESHDDFERGTYGVTSDGTGRLRIGFLDRQVAAVRGEIDSGDRARISGGSVFLLGRDDGVVKLSGRRVSLTQVGRTLAPELGFRDWKVDTCLSGKRQFLVMVGRSVERDVPSSRWTSFSGLSVRVIFIDEWPLSLTGKLDFRGGWEAQVNQDDEVSLSAGSFSEDYCPAEPLSSRDYEDSELRTRVCNVVHKVLERPMNLDDLFSSVGASSLEMLDIHVQLGRELVDAPVPSSMQSLGTFAAMCTVRAKD